MLSTAHRRFSVTTESLNWNTNGLPSVDTASMVMNPWSVHA